MKDIFDPAVSEQLPLRWATWKGYTFLVRELLSDPRLNLQAFFEHKEHPIGTAARAGHVEIVKLFLKHPDINPTMDDNYPIRVANHFKQTEVVKVLLEDSRVKSSLKGDAIKPLFPIPNENLNDIGWVGICSRQSAESLLAGKPEGTFAVRWSVNAKSYVLSYLPKRSQEIEHIRILPKEDGKVSIFTEGGELYDTIKQYIQSQQYFSILSDPYNHHTSNRYGRSYILSAKEKIF